jgi:acid phosphatase (class A)
MRCLLRIVILVAALVAAPAFAQQLEREPPPADESPVSGYLAGHPVDYRVILAAPPPVDSIEDKADQRVVEDWQKAPETRRQSATLDDHFVYPRFDAAFGRPVDRQTSPTLIRMLTRGLRDVAATTFSAKDHFQRPRPFQRVQLQHLCGGDVPPKPEPHPSGGSSYPSGHSAYGWAVAMMLARVAPERSAALMARADEYAESRVICGMHFPSDVSAGQAVAAAVVNHLDALPEFQADLARARAELAASR